MPVTALRTTEKHFADILKAVSPRRLASEMSKADRAFFIRYFKGIPMDKIGRGKIKAIAQKEIFSEGDGHELFANLLIIHWNEKNVALYRDMVKHVEAINEDVEAIERIEDEDADKIIDDLLARYDKSAIYLCTILNGVRFDDAVIAARLTSDEQGDAEQVSA